MWRFEEGQLSFEEAMQETSALHERKLQYERKPPPRPAAGNEGVRESMRIAQEKLREAQAWYSDLAWSSSDARKSGCAISQSARARSCTVLPCRYATPYSVTT